MTPQQFQDALDDLATPEIHHVVITGGEPLIHDLDPLMLYLRSRLDPDVTIQVETSGYSEFKGLAYPNWLTWSPKEKLDFHTTPEIYGLANEIKFVVDGNVHFPTVDSVINYWTNVIGIDHTTGEPNKEYPWIYLMPEGTHESKYNLETLTLLKVLSSRTYGHRVRFGGRLQYVLNVR